MGMEKFHMYAQLYESERRFNRACEQITHLNGKIQDLQTRYAKARDANDRLFRYNLRMRLLVVEGLVQRYCHYASLKKSEVLDLRFKLYGEYPDEEDLPEEDGTEEESPEEETVV